MHLGQKRGMDIWILGIVERESNRLVLYPVNDRSRDTLLRKYHNITNKNHYSVFAINDTSSMDNSPIRSRTRTECKQCEKYNCVLFVSHNEIRKSHMCPGSLSYYDCRFSVSTYFGFVFPYTALIQRHVTAGSTIYTDGWSSYMSLDDEGYDHFVVEHKHAFKYVYRKKETNELIEVHTNRIEGAWKHAKVFFIQFHINRLYPYSAVTPVHY